MTPRALIVATRAHLRHELGREAVDAEVIERLAGIAANALRGMSWGYLRLPAMKQTRPPKDEHVPVDAVTKGKAREEGATGMQR